MIYAMSDIHGCFDLYKRMIEKIRLNDSDTLYILGDIVDRGENSIKILFDIMARPNVKLLLGNHDYRMLSVIQNNDFASFEDAVKYSLDNELLDNWIRDGGENTLRAYCKLPASEKKRIIEFLSGCTLADIVQTGGNSFFLSHTAPEKDKFNDLSKAEAFDFTWGNIDYSKQYFENAYLVTGHTVTLLIDQNYRRRIYKAKGHIALDCGAVFFGRLGCLCLDTMEEIYVSRWDGMSFCDIAKDITGAEEVAENMSIADILGVDANKYKSVPFEHLKLTLRAYNCLNRYLNPPLADYPGRIQLGSIYDLLEMTIKELSTVRNLGMLAYIEILELLTEFTNVIR